MNLTTLTLSICFVAMVGYWVGKSAGINYAEKIWSGINEIMAEKIYESFFRFINEQEDAELVKGFREYLNDDTTYKEIEKECLDFINKGGKE